MAARVPTVSRRQGTPETRLARESAAVQFCRDGFGSRVACLHGNFRRLRVATPVHAEKRDGFGRAVHGHVVATRDSPDLKDKKSPHLGGLWS